MLKKKILVSGCAGFIGSVLLKYLHNTKNEIYVTVNKTKIKKYKNIHYLSIDLTSEKGIKKLFKHFSPDIFFHLAALKNPKINEENKNFAKKINYKTNTLIAKHMSKDTHLVFLSTDKVYSPHCKFANEQSVCKPKTLYGKLKLQSENIFLKKFSKIHIVRVPIVHGSSKSGSSFIDDVVKKINKGKNVLVANNIVRSFVKVKDLAKFLVKLCNKKNYGVYNIGTTGESYLKRVNKSLKSNKKKKLLIPDNNLLIHLQHQELVTDKIKQVFNEVFL
mgnify:FL=1